MSKAYSYAPFHADNEMLQEVMSHHEITPQFISVVFSFRRQVNRLEEAFCDSLWAANSGNIQGTFDPHQIIPKINHATEASQSLSTFSSFLKSANLPAPLHIGQYGSSEFTIASMRLRDKAHGS
jgi:hypothetical protein